MDDFNPLVLDNNPDRKDFTPLKTTYLVSFLITLMVSVELVTLAYVFVWTDSHVRCDLFYLLIYADVCLWLINFVIRGYIKWRHKRSLIKNNFLESHEECIPYIELPFYIFCIWLGILVVLLCLYAEYNVPHKFYCDSSHFYSPIVAITVVIITQNVLIIPFHAIYIIKINAVNQNPWTLELENSSWMSHPLQESLTSADFGSREHCEQIDIKLEKQANLIRHYKETNDALRQQIFHLIAQEHTATEH